MKNLLFLITLFFISDVSLSQNVGIGTNNPLAKLDILGGNLAVNDSLLLLRSGIDRSHYLQFSQGAVNGPRLAGWSGGVLSSSANGSLRDVLRWNDAGNIGIGTISPVARLDVRGGHIAINDSAIRLRGGEDSFHFLKFDPVINGPRLAGYWGGVLSGTGANGITDVLRWTETGKVGIGTINPQANLDLNGSLKITDGTQGAGKVLTSDASGNASWQDLPGKQVAFKAQLRFTAPTITTSLDPVIFDTTYFNNGGGYNETTGIFTAPSAGTYYFYAQLEWWTTDRPHTVGLQIIPTDYGQSVWYGTEYSATIQDKPVTNASGFFYLNIGNTVKIKAWEESDGTAQILPFAGNTHFFGYKIY